MVFPVPESQMKQTFAKWLISDPNAQAFLSANDFAVQNDIVDFFRIGVRSIGLPWDDYSVKWPLY